MSNPLALSMTISEPDAAPEHDAFEFVAISALPTTTLLPPVTTRSSALASVRFGRRWDGRSVTSPYCGATTMPATDVDRTVQFWLLNMRPKVSPKLGCQTLTWTARRGSQSTQLGDGVWMDTR